MPWWGWLTLGFLLLAVELFVIDAQFYLVFIGAAGIVVGLLGLSGVELPEWTQWASFAVLAIVAMFTFRRRVYETVRGRSGSVQERVTPGDRVLVPQRLEPGQTCRVDYRGSTWTARNADARAIEAGSEALISHVEDLTLFVKLAA